MNRRRRTLLRYSAGLTGWLAVSLWRPFASWAASRRNAAAFVARDLATARAASGIPEQPLESSALTLDAPDAAENGALVAFTAVSRIPDTTALTFFVDHNPFPLSARFEFGNGARAEVSVYLRMDKTSLVRVVAQAGDTFYSAQKEVAVTISGCS
ncbi:MAG: thiosulfate oxidation carrier protein SoxY [Betaproteobacteria bacterium HGW-Betaproteobacteria-11]|nr:MAG: thiosulfate oxidation carrier protein SoxY [Betaproteobacteria bacterium HGW-Betaproteobacteria-11]